jgi:hypothetical protein
MENILNTTDIVNAIKTIEIESYEVTIDHEKFYERVKGLISLVKENLVKSGFQRF